MHNSMTEAPAFLDVDIQCFLGYSGLFFVRQDDLKPPSEPSQHQ
jgi:hypothetical protein